MKGSLAFVSVTAVLKSMLENRFAEEALVTSLGDVQVSAVAPDRIPVGADERSQVNVFMYRLTPNRSLRMREFLLRTSGTPNPVVGALPVDLHYLLSAYGDRDFIAEILLEQAICVMQEAATMSAGAFHSALDFATHARVAEPAGLGRLAEAAQFTQTGEQITITPEFLSSDELSRMWSALQAPYRPSATYRISSVLIGRGGE
jgi:hypothetical protein